VVNYCDINACHSTALCTLSSNSKNRTCFCADNQIEVPMLMVCKLVLYLCPLKIVPINVFSVYTGW